MAKVSTDIFDKYKKFFDLKGLIKDIKAYLPKFDDKKFLEAFVFAEEAHEGQMRKDGITPYIVHPVLVVQILAGIHADEDILISALLHDVPEDTKRTLEEINEKFGRKIEFLVDGITKLSKVHYKNDMPSRQVESLKKMFIHSAQDPRAIIIKLADRLHNMRTLDNIPRMEKRVRIAGETLEIYVPIANLLGIQEMKSELENLCFKYLFAPEYNALEGKIFANEKEHKAALKQFKLSLRKELKANHIEVEISPRKRNLYSIYKKLCSIGRSIEDAEDRLAVRIVVDKIFECYQVLGIIHNHYTPKINRFRDYIANPKSNGYQSLHTTVFGPDGILTEIQIKTHKMHIEAEYGIAANFLAGSADQISEDKRSDWVSRVVEIDKQMNGNDEFIERLKSDILEDRIIVFTPKGDSVDLPKDASAIDFAYAIHTDVGNHASKAVVNGKVMSLNSTLGTGDVVNILVSDHSIPDIGWLSIVKTNLAKNRIKEFLKKTNEAQKIQKGRMILQKEMDIAGLGVIEMKNFKRPQKVIESKLGRSFKSWKDLFIAIGEGEIKAVDVAKSIAKYGKKQTIDKQSGLKIRLKIVAKDRDGLLNDIAKVLYKYALNMSSLKAWVTGKDNTAYFSCRVVVSDIEVVGKIFSELQHIDEVRAVYRFYHRGIYLTTGLLFLTTLAWILHPVLLNAVGNSGLTSSPFILDVYASGLLFILLGGFLYSMSVLKKYFPLLRNQMLLWIITFTVPSLVLISLLIEIMYFNLNLNWGTLIVEVLVFYSYLVVSFLNFKRYSKR